MICLGVVGMDNWFEYIRYNIRAQPETPAVVMEDRVVTYGMLGDAIEACAQRIAALDFPKDSLVAICLQNPVRHLTIFFALFRIGVCSISLEPMHQSIAGLNLTVVLADDPGKSAFARSNRIVEITDDWFSSRPVKDISLPAPFSGEQEVCRQSLTSGSTGEPKVVDNTVGYYGRDIITGIMSFNCELLLSWVGLASAFGLKIACGTLASGKTLCFATSPFQAIRMIELFSIDMAVMSTDQMVSLVRAVRKTGAQLKSLRTAVAGGSVPTRALLEAAAINLCKDVRSRYGTSEVGLLGLARAADMLSKPGFAGYISPGFDVEVFDFKGRRHQPGEIGIVKARVKRNSELEQNPWTDHGDVGWLTADGQLFIVGRKSDIADLSTTARKIPPALEVEHLVRLEWDASDAGAVMIEDPRFGAKPEIWVATVDCKDASREKLQAIMRERGIESFVRIFPLMTIPRGANGKIQRERLKSMLLSAAGMQLFEKS